MYITEVYRKLLPSAAFCFGIVLMAPALFAQTELRVATIAPAGTPWVENINRWKANLESLSEGELTLRIFPGGQLGNEVDTFRQTRRGRIDIVVLGGGTLSEQVKEISLMSTPFLFDELSVIDCVYDGAFGDTLAQKIGDKDVNLLYWGEVGWGGVFAKDDLSNVNDIAGYKVRVGSNEMSRLFWASLNASGIELPYAELAGALQTGMVDAGEATGLTYVAFGFDKVAPHFVFTKHGHQAGAVMIGQRSWEQLTPSQQQMLKDSIPDVSELRETVRNISDNMIDQHAANGGYVHKLTDVERQAWKAMVEPNWHEFVEGLGPGAEVLWPQLLDAKAACKGQ